jgi:hypothetical protein
MCAGLERLGASTTGITLTSVGFDGSKQKLVNFYEPTGANGSSVNFREPKVTTEGS